jgi:hypothetical protein
MMLRIPSVRHDRLTRLHNTAFVLAAFAVVVSSLALAPEADAARGRRGGGKAAAAPHGKTKVGVAAFTGPGEAASRAAVTKALSSKKIVVVSGAELGAAAKQLHVRLDDDSGFKAVAQSLNLTGMVQGEVSAKKATLTVRNGQDGSVVGEESFTGNDPKQVAGVISKTFWKRLAAAFNKTNPPSGGGGGGIDTSDEGASSAAATESEPSSSSASENAKPAREEVAAAEPERKPARKANTESEESGGGRPKAKASSSEGGEEAASEPGASPWFDGAVGLADLMRSLSYKQQLNYSGATRVANYSLPQSPVVVGKFDIYPGAMLDAGGFANDVGLTLDLGYLLPVVTTPGEGGSYKTASLAWAVGPKVRLPAGFFATVAYGNRWFKLEKSNANMAPSTTVPLTDYKFVRIGAGIKHQVSTSLSLMANLAYDRCLGTPSGIGGAAYFPRTTCAALEAGAGAGYSITNSIELRAGVDLQRFGLAFNTTPNDVGKTPIAGGAIDQYIQLYVMVAYVMGGGGAASGGDAESADTAKDEAKKDNGDKGGEDDKDDDKDEGDGKDE